MPQFQIAGKATSELSTSEKPIKPVWDLRAWHVFVFKVQFNKELVVSKELHCWLYKKSNGPFYFY